jgi:hypothetical protein
MTQMEGDFFLDTDRPHTRFSVAGITGTIHALQRPATEKRQGTKSREVWQGGASGAMGIWPRAQG